MRQSGSSLVLYLASLEVRNLLLEGECPSCYPSHPSVGPLVVMLHPVCGGRIVALIGYFVGGSAAARRHPHYLAMLGPSRSPFSLPLPVVLPIVMESPVVETGPPV